MMNKYQNFLFNCLYDIRLLVALSMWPTASINPRMFTKTNQGTEKDTEVCFCRCSVEAGLDYSTDDLPDPEVWARMLSQSPIKHVTQVWMFQHM